MRHQSHGPLAMNLLRRQFLHLAAGAAALPALSRMSWAQTYPSRPVRLLIGFSAGGGADIVGRLIGQWLQERLGQAVVIENRPGAGTNVATEALVRAPADGYTLGLIGLPNAINATLYDKLSFNFIRDVTPVAGILRTPEIMVVNLSVPAKTLSEFIAHAKANPGKINMGSAGNGSVSHVAGELFMFKAGLRMVHVPYRGAAPALTDLLGGQVQVMFGAVSATMPYTVQERCVRWRSPAPRAQNCCQTSQPWANWSRATRRAPGTASGRPKARPSRLSIGSTRR
jgi:tripartite-type tricarboxylate transporter receptor subunit TctC